MYAAGSCPVLGRSPSQHLQLWLTLLAQSRTRAAGSADVATLPCNLGPLRCVHSAP